MTISFPASGLIMRHVYFDEAGIGNPDSEPYTVVAGIMLHVDKQYEALQKYLLDMADDLVASEFKRPAKFVFHAKELWHGSGFFPRDEWSLQKRLEILGHLADIPAKFELPIIYSCVKRAELSRKYKKKTIKESNKICHTTCFLSCLSQVERWMEKFHKEEKAFAVVENHNDHKDFLSGIAQLLANPRIRSVIENDPNVSWAPLTYIVDEPLFVGKSGTSPVQIADVCAFILARALANANHSESLLKKIEPQLVSGFRRQFVTVSSSKGELS